MVCSLLMAAGRPRSHWDVAGIRFSTRPARLLARRRTPSLRNALTRLFDVRREHQTVGIPTCGVFRRTRRRFPTVTGSGAVRAIGSSWQSASSISTRCQGPEHRSRAVASGPTRQGSCRAASTVHQHASIGRCGSGTGRRGCSSTSQSTGPAPLGPRHDARVDAYASASSPLPRRGSTSPLGPGPRRARRRQYRVGHRCLSSNGTSRTPAARGRVRSAGLRFPEDEPGRCADLRGPTLLLQQ